MIDAGIGPTHVNAMLSAMNVPTVAHGTLDRRRQEGGAAIELVAREACDAAVAEEILAYGPQCTDSPVPLTVSFDMGWQKRGRAHNSLTGEVLNTSTGACTFSPKHTKCDKSPLIVDIITRLPVSGNMVCYVYRPICHVYKFWGMNTTSAPYS